MKRKQIFINVMSQQKSTSPTGGNLVGRLLPASSTGSVSAYLSRTKETNKFARKVSEIKISRKRVVAITYPI